MTGIEPTRVPSPPAPGARPARDADRLPPVGGRYRNFLLSRLFTFGGDK